MAYDAHIGQWRIQLLVNEGETSDMTVFMRIADVFAIFTDVDWEEKSDNVARIPFSLSFTIQMNRQIIIRIYVKLPDYVKIISS